MRERENGSERALWDPLWEYILDDHDSSEEKPRYRLRRQKPLEQETNRSNTFALEKDSSTDSDVEESWYDSRQERNNRRRKSKIPASNRRSQLTEDSGVDNSLWGFLAGGEEVAQSKRKPEKITRRQTQTVIPTETASDKTNKKGLFRRFRRDDKSMSRSAKDKRKIRAVAPVPPPTSPSATSNKTLSSPKEEIMDPFQMFMDVAAMLDPFGSDESDSEESSAATHEKIEAGRELGSQLYNGDNESVGELDELPQPSQTVNEIRLNFNPKRTEIDNDAEGERRNSIEEASEDTISDEQDDDIVVSAPRAKIDESGTVVNLNMNPGDKSELQSFREDIVVEPVLDIDGKSSQAADEIDPSIRESEMEQKVKLFSLRHLICRSGKNRHDSYGIDSFPIDIAKNKLPATRMVSDNDWDTPKVMIEGANQRHGLGVLSDHLETTKGPQSVYEYDYEHQLHLDAFYTAMGANPRGTVVVRKLGKPPLLNPSSMRNEVIIQVEASTVSETDCMIRQGYWWGREMAPLSNTPGVDVVGKVFQIKQHVGIQHGLQVAQGVLSLTRWGGNSRFVAIDPTKLVKIPNYIDPAEAACLPETYLTAFQVLHYTQVGQKRYDKSSLRGKSVLIVGSMTNNLGKAIIELALDAGVAYIYATAKKKHWKTLVSYGVMPLSVDPLEWISRVEGTIDMILATNSGFREDITRVHYQALRPRTGRLIMCGHRVLGNDLPVGDGGKFATHLVCAKQKDLTKMMNQSHSYDVYEHWDMRLDLCKRDLEHLLGLLQQGTIKPKILDRIPLTKVARAHELLESKRLSGFLICEPWMTTKKRAIYI